MFPLTRKALLVLAPHPDDEVIGCGGLMSTVKEQGGQVFVLYFTVATTRDFSRRGRSTKIERLREIRSVAKHFFLDGWRLVFPNSRRHLAVDRVPQKHLIHEIERGAKISLEAVRPDILALPLADDYNQDHRAIAMAAIAACRPAPRKEKWVPPLVVSYESPMNQWLIRSVSVPNVFLALSRGQLAKKLRGMDLYASQVRPPGHPRSSRTLKALAVVRGASVGAEFAEAYHAQKMEVA